MARLAFADDEAALHIERGKQRGRAVALVVVGHGAGAALLHRQARLGAVERLDLALLIDAQHQRLVRRVQIEADDIGDLLLELRVVGDLERLDEMRLEAGLGPDAPHAGRADPHLGRHGSPAPVRRVRGRLVGRLGQHLVLDRGRQRLLARRPRLVAQQALDALVDVALLPAPHARLRFARAPHDLVGAAPIRRRQNDLGAPHHLRRRVAVSDQSRQPSAAGRAHIKADVVPSHGRRLTDLRQFGYRLLGVEHYNKGNEFHATKQGVRRCGQGHWVTRC